MGNLMMNAEKIKTGAGALASFVFLWEITAGWSMQSWGVGIFAVVTASVVLLALRPDTADRFVWRGLVRFVPYFCAQSLRGGVDVARRAFSSHLPLDPVLLEHPLELPPGTARLFMVNVVSLLPGTLSADVRGDCLIVHALDRALAAELARLEQKVKALFASRAG